MDEKAFTRYIHSKLGKVLHDTQLIENIQMGEHKEGKSTFGLLGGGEEKIDTTDVSILQFDTIYDYLANPYLLFELNIRKNEPIIPTSIELASVLSVSTNEKVTISKQNISGDENPVVNLIQTDEKLGNFLEKVPESLKLEKVPGYRFKKLEMKHRYVGEVLPLGEKTFVGIKALPIIRGKTTNMGGKKMRKLVGLPFHFQIFGKIVYHTASLRNRDLPAKKGDIEDSNLLLPHYLHDRGEL